MCYAQCYICADVKQYPDCECETYFEVGPFTGCYCSEAKRLGWIRGDE